MQSFLRPRRECDIGEIGDLAEMDSHTNSWVSLEGCLELPALDSGVAI